jgi:hypothetical protein
MQTENSFALHSSRNNLVEFLREHKLESAAAWVLDMLGPMSVVLAQFVHAGSALLRPTLTAEQVDSLTQILEDPTEMHIFKALLREDISNGK